MLLALLGALAPATVASAGALGGGAGGVVSPAGSGTGEGSAGGLSLPNGLPGSLGGPPSPGLGMPGGAIPGMGTGGGGSAVGALGAGGTLALADSGYSLTQVDPLTGVVDGGSLTGTLTDATATEAQLEQDSMLAINAAQLAQQARQQAAAKQRAAEAAQSNGSLTPGTVPAPYAQILESAIGSCPGLPIGVAAAQLAQESGFNPNAVSSAGAEGIAQFTPPAWQAWAVNADGKTPPSPFDPYDAIPAMVDYDCSLLHAVSGIGADPISLMLAAYNAGLAAVQQYGGVPPFTQTETYVRNIEANASRYGSSTVQAGQTSVSTNGCPTSAPPGTLLDGAPSLATLCAQSVSQARSPQAAHAIIYALDHLGATYSQPLRNAPGYYDCSSLVSRAYEASGVPLAPAGKNAPTTYTIANASWAIRESLASAKPGDLEEPTPDHVVMLLADGYVVQAPFTGQPVDVVSNWTSSPYLVAWVNASGA